MRSCATGLAVDHDDVTLASQHPLHLRCRSYGPSGVDSDVGDHQEPFTSRLDKWVAFDDDRAVQAREQLIGDIAMVMRVVPEHARRVVDTELVLVVERPPGSIITNTLSLLPSDETTSPCVWMFVSESSSLRRVSAIRSPGRTLSVGPGRVPL